MADREEKRLGNLVPYIMALGLHAALHRHFGFLRRFNGPYVSGYAMAVYRRGVWVCCSADQLSPAGSRYASMRISATSGRLNSWGGISPAESMSRTLVPERIRC
jgi:hypothetical protein